MGTFEKAKAIMDIDLDNLTDAFIYHAVYLNLSEFSTKFQMNSHADVYEDIDLYFKDGDKQIIVNLRYCMAETSNQPYLTIHQSGSKVIDVENNYAGMDEERLRFLVKFATLEDYKECYTYYNYPITAGGYFENGKMYSGQSYKEFMANGGKQIEVLFKTAQSESFPEILHEYHKQMLKEDWKKQVYDEILESMETGEFDIAASCLHEHIKKDEFNYLKRFFFDYLDIKVLNARKRNLFI